MALSRGSKLFLAVLAGGALLLLGGLLWVNHLLGGEPGPGDPVVIEVDQGSTAASIGDQLASEEVVRSSLAFRLMARSRGLDATLQAGTYELETGMSVDEAIDTLLAGPREPDTFEVTVPEGLTVAQTLEILAGQAHTVADYRAVLDAGELNLPSWVPDLTSFGPEVREPYEGLLFPETYRFEADATPREILQRMVEQLTRVMDRIPSDRVESLRERDLSRYRALVMASLVERETRVADERARVARVILNRIERGMPLQIDATVLYAMNTQKERVLEDDLDTPSPYNTYLPDSGLPPTPISGVGAASIEAVFDPDDVPFLYYVLSPECDGSHTFAETLEEHNRNVAALREAPCAPS